MTIAETLATRIAKVSYDALPDAARHWAKVAIMDNGEKKGGTIEAWDTIHASPGILDIWQLHFSAAGGQQHNTGEKMIANMATAGDAGNVLKLTAHSDGHFEVTNPATGYSKKY